MYADVHCHLDYFKDIKPIIEKAKSAKVNFLISNSTHLESIRKHINLINKFPELKIALGIHPVDLLRLSPEQREEGLKLIENNAEKILGFGETGLDYKYAKTDEEKALQKDFFKTHIELSLQYNKPVIAHSRYAEKPVIDFLEENNAEKVLLHWFSNSAKLAKKAAENGYFISVGPSILKNPIFQAVVKEIPLESLLLETDTPVSFDGKSSSPDWIPLVAEKAAEIHEISLEELQKKLGQNLKKLFGI